MGRERKRDVSEEGRDGEGGREGGRRRKATNVRTIIL